MREFLESLLPLCSQPGDHAELWSAVLQAQRDSAQQNPSASKAVAAVTAEGSGSFIHSVCAAMLTVGAKHGPIGKARDVLRYVDPATAEAIAASGGVVPGFGSSFHKGVIDPCWAQVEAILEKSYPDTYAKLRALESALAAAGKNLRPNPAGFTAAACEATGVPVGVEEALFVMPRIFVWWSEYRKAVS